MAGPTPLRTPSAGTSNLYKKFCAPAEAGIINSMSAYDQEPDRVWNEYEWERFLQQQDHKTEKYMALLETYLDHPQRDQIIAQEMGWTQLLDSKDWSADVDALLGGNDAQESETELGDEGDGAADTFED